MIKDPNALTDRFQEGVDARAQGRARHDNPCGITTDDHAEWDAGWRAVCDLDEDDDPESTRDHSEPVAPTDT